MSITLTDKNNLDRTSPTPNVDDRLNPGSQSALNTLSTVFKTPQSSHNVARIIFQNNAFIGYDQTNVPIAFFGFNPDDNTIVLQIAPDGVNVFDADNTELTFNSLQDVLKVDTSDSFTFPSVGNLSGNTTGSLVTKAIPHELTIIPNFQCFAKIDANVYGNPFGGGEIYVPFSTLISTGKYGYFPYGITIIDPVNTQVRYDFIAAIDDTNLYIGELPYNLSGSTLPTTDQTINYSVFSNSIPNS